MRIVVAALVVVGLGFHASDPWATEQKVVDLFHSLPDGATTFFRLLYDLITLWALALLSVTVLFARRWRLARDLLVAGAGAWLLGRIVAFFVLHTDLWKSLQVTFDFGDAPRFPTVRLAVVVGDGRRRVAVPGPPGAPARRGPRRRCSRSRRCTSAAASRPTSSARSCSAGASRRPSTTRSARPIGRPTARSRGRGARRGSASTCNGRRAGSPSSPSGAPSSPRSARRAPLRVTALGRDEADAQLLARAWRYLATARTRRAPCSGPAGSRSSTRRTSSCSPPTAGVRVPGVVLRRQRGPGRACSSSTHVPARALFDTRRRRGHRRGARRRRGISSVACARAHIAHGKLDGHHLLVDGEQTVVTGFEWATTSAGFGQAAADVANLLAATAAVVGHRARGRRGRGAGSDDDALLAALPMLQPAVDLRAGPTTRSAAAAGSTTSSPSSASATAGALGTEPPELRQLYRVHPAQPPHGASARWSRSRVLFSRVGDPEEFWHSLRDANWWYVALAFVLGDRCTDVGVRRSRSSATSRSASRSGRASSCSRAMSFSNLAVPVAADTAIQVRFLQKQGLDLPSAVATGGVLSSVSEIIVQVGAVLRRGLARAGLHRLRPHRHRAARRSIALIVVFVVGGRARGRLRRAPDPAPGAAAGRTRDAAPCGTR